MIYYSHRTRKALAEGRTYLPLGFAHYSYGNVCRNFISAFEENSIEAQEVMLPEIYANLKDIFPNRESKIPLHIAFKPFNEIRLLKGAINVAHVYWEFGQLPQIGELPTDHGYRANIMNDYVHVLSMVSEIWVGCSYTKQVFESYGLCNVQIIPAPVAASGTGRDLAARRTVELRPLGSLDLSRKRVLAYLDDVGPQKLDSGTLFRADDCIAAGGRIFVSVFNPGDPRKNAAAMILGFQRYLSHSKRNDLLIIKLVIDDRPEMFRTTLSEYFPKQFSSSGIPFSYVDCKNILLIPGSLSETEMKHLYSIADFYLCTSSAEGQGLPLQEAMALGVVPIAPCETAMQDYIRPDNAIILNATEGPLPLQITNAYALGCGTWKSVNYREVASGLSNAIALSPSDYAYKSASAAALIKEAYGREHVVQLVLERLAEG